MKQKLWIGLATGLMMLGMVEVAGATLVTIGTATYGTSSYNLIWDANNNGHSVVWLDYSHAADTWANQNAWADGLNGLGVLSYNLTGYSVNWGTNAWRLPTTVDGVKTYGYDGTTTAGYNITSSEMGYLYYTDLGNKSYWDTDGDALQAGGGLTRVGDFANLQPPWFWYWSGTESAANGGGAWGFYMCYGGQNVYSEDTFISGLAVRTGQVTYSGGATPTPEPATMLLLGTGLAGLIGGRMKRRRGRAA